jgi:hypothetical protein
LGMVRTDARACAGSAPTEEPEQTGDRSAVAQALGPREPVGHARSSQTGPATGSPAAQGDARRCTGDAGESRQFHPSAVCPNPVATHHLSAREPPSSPAPCPFTRPELHGRPRQPVTGTRPPAGQNRRSAGEPPGRRRVAPDNAMAGVAQHGGSDAPIGSLPNNPCLSLRFSNSPEAGAFGRNRAPRAGRRRGLTAH